MTRSHSALKAVLVVCMAAMVALAIAGCSSQSQASSSAASSATGSEASSTASSEASSESSSAAESESSSEAAIGLAVEEGETVAGKSAGSSSKSSTSSTSASTGSSTSIATGQLVDVTNKTTGYTFKTDKGYDVKFDGSDTTVYTSSKSGAVPFFELTLMQNSTGRSVEDFLTEYANGEMQTYKGKMVIDPIANTVKLNGRTVKGIEYMRKNDAGDKNIAVMTYVEEYSGYFFTWRTICYQTDSETPAAMETAMNTFKFLAS